METSVLSTAEQIASYLRNLSDAEFAKASERFLSLLDSGEPQYVPASFSRESLLDLTKIYSNEYAPLMEEWKRRQVVGFDEKYSSLLPRLRGQLPQELKEEMRGLNRRQIEGKSWNPAVDGRRINFLNKIDDFYNNGGELPFCWLNFLVKNSEGIKLFQRGLWKKQGKADLPKEDRMIVGFLNRIDRDGRLFKV